MKKKVLGGLLVSFFSVGVITDHYEILPYQYLNEINELLFTHKNDEIQSYIYEKNINFRRRWVHWGSFGKKIIQ